MSLLRQRALGWLVWLLFASVSAQADTGLSEALKAQLWQAPQPEFQQREMHFSSQPGNAGSTDYLSDPPDAVRVTETPPDGQQICMQGSCVDTTRSIFGRLPPLRIVGGLDFLETRIRDRHFRIFMATGAGIFASGTRQRYSFIHVFEGAAHHALVAEGYLGEAVLGRLPGSNTLNYARLVPTDWLQRGEARRYEVLLYRLGCTRPQRVWRAGKPLAYSLERQALDAPWKLILTDATPVADALDAALAPAGIAPFVPATHP